MCVCVMVVILLIREAQRKEMAAISFFTFFTMEKKETDGSQKGVVVVIDC